jgi:hypothetical protein
MMLRTSERAADPCFQDSPSSPPSSSSASSSSYRESHSVSVSLRISARLVGCLVVGDYLPGFASAFLDDPVRV